MAQYLVMDEMGGLSRKRYDVEIDETTCWVSLERSQDLFIPYASDKLEGIAQEAITKNE